MHVVVAEPQYISDYVLDKLLSLGSVELLPSPPELSSDFPDCDILMIRLGKYIGPELLGSVPSLKFIVSATTGLDHIDLEAAHRRGIKILSLRDCPTKIVAISATAEHTWGLLLALVRATTKAARHVLEGGWDRNRFWGTQLKGKRLGIIGFGRIGQRVAGYAHAFGMRVFGCDIQPGKIQLPTQPLDLDELAATCDIISIHVGGIPENHHLLSQTMIRSLKPGAWVVNTSRGSVVDEAALAEAVVSGHIAGVAVDVLDGEERGETGLNPLFRCALAGHNVLITPHLGGATYESIAHAEKAVVDVLLTALAKPANGQR